VGDQFQGIQEIGHPAGRVEDEYAGGVSTGPVVLGQVPRHGVFVEREEEPPFSLGPDEDCRVIAAQRQVGWVADADGVNRQPAAGVVALDRPPERPAEVFVENEAERHCC
jgi:hypothetical protein